MSIYAEVFTSCIDGARICFIKLFYREKGFRLLVINIYHRKPELAVEILGVRLVLRFRNPFSSKNEGSQ